MRKWSPEVEPEQVLNEECPKCSKEVVPGRPACVDYTTGDVYHEECMAEETKAFTAHELKVYSEMVAEVERQRCIKAIDEVGDFATVAAYESAIKALSF